MAVIILLITYLITVYVLILYKNSIRESVVKAALILYLISVLILETLSIFEFIEFYFLLIAWLLVIAIEIALIFVFHKKNIGNANFQETLTKLRSFFSSKFNVILFAIILIIFLITFFIAVASPPNNYDSMTYHMPRVSHWIQNKSIKFFETTNTRQNLSMPLAEYAILNVQILSKSDRYANLVQWTSFLTIIILVSLVAKKMGANTRLQLMISFLASTLPMGLLQSSTTQNDLVVGMFCLSFLYFMILVREQNTPENAVFAAFSMGLALLTKGTGYIFCAGIGSVYGIYALITSRKESIFKNFLVLISIVGIALLINAGHIIRLIDYSSEQFAAENQHIIVDKISVVNTWSNLLRNGVMHLATLNQATNDSTESSVENILGNEINNPETTFPDY